MKKITITLMMLMLCSLMFAQNGKTPPEDTRALPEGLVVVKGKLKAKAGYQFQLSADGKSATLVNAKGVSTSGTFSCGCGNNSSSGACSVVILNGGLNCTGNCSCQLVTIITSIRYAVDLSAGVLKKQ
ncbi:MAG: hypothetical protein IPG86_11740 [Chitinophagaceae bacterium]|jgi:hypothetical protein|nr:hypothetical protein [Chitinophagaceae bacterium]